MVKIFSGDGGNTKFKGQAYDPRTHARVEVELPHKFLQISKGDYDRALSRAGADSEDFFVVNDVPYVIGEKAGRYGKFVRKDGVLRYVPQYYGVLAAITMTQAFGKSTKDIFYMGGFPPKDEDYQDDLLGAVVQDWHVVWKGKEITLNVVDGSTFDEPLGGWANVTLTQDGTGYSKNAQRRAINNGVALVIDVGGYTTDGIVIDPGGKVDYTSGRSETIGVLDAVEQFEKDFRSEHPTLLKGQKISDTMVHEAIRTGVFNLRGLGTHDCSELAKEVTAALVDKVVNFYESFGGAALYDTLILTGGGSALLETQLKKHIVHNNIVMADDDTATMHRANSRGGLKWCNLQFALGTYKV